MDGLLTQTTFDALGTTCSVLTTDERDHTAVEQAVREEVRKVDASCSRFRDDSDLSAVNRANGAWISVGPLFLDYLRGALRGAAVTGGLVDPTMGSVLRRYGYDRNFALGPLVRPSTDSYIVVPGWQAIEIDGETSRVRVPYGTSLDFGATAKAQAADRCLVAALERTDGGVLVNLGGDIAASPHPTGRWSVGVDDDHRTTSPRSTIAIVGGGVATSSTTVRAWNVEGRPVHHIIDPRTLQPSTVVWRTATVHAADCLDANIATTAALVLGANAFDWLTGQNLDAQLIHRDGSVQLCGRWPDGGSS